jgi:hypothetical protein
MEGPPGVARPSAAGGFGGGPGRDAGRWLGGDPRRQLEMVELFFHPVQLGESLGADPLAVIRRWFEADVWP